MLWKVCNSSKASNGPNSVMQMAMRGAMPPTYGPFELFNKELVQKCYLDKRLLQAKDIWILRSYLQTPNNQLAMTHIPTVESFALHTIDQDTVDTFRALNLDGYFSLPAWGPDIQRAYEVIHTYDPITGYIRLTDLDGLEVRILLTVELVKRALNFGDALLYTETRFTRELSKETSDHANPKFSQLKHRSIRTALELFTQHFKLSYPQKFTKPETRIARQFTLAALRSPEARKDFSDYISKEIKNARSYKAKKGPYLGGVLALTRIAYMGLGRIDNLPPPLAATNELGWKIVRSSHLRHDIRSPSPASDQEDESNEEDDEEEEGREDNGRMTEFEFPMSSLGRADPEELGICMELVNETRRVREEVRHDETVQPLKDFSLFGEPDQVYVEVPMNMSEERVESINLVEPNLDDICRLEEEERLRKYAVEHAKFHRHAEEQAEIQRKLEAQQLREQQLAIEEDMIRKLEALKKEQEGFFKLAEIKRRQETEKLRGQRLAVEEDIRKKHLEAQRKEEERLFQLAEIRRKQEAWQLREWQLAVEEDYRRQHFEAQRREEERLFQKMKEAQHLREQQLALEDDIRKQHVEAQKREAERLIKWKQEVLQMAEREDIRKQEVDSQRREEERLLKLAHEEQTQRVENDRHAREQWGLEVRLQEDEECKLKKDEEKRQKKSRTRLLLRQHLRSIVRQAITGGEDLIKQRVQSPQLPEEQVAEGEAVAEAQAVTQSEEERMDIDQLLKESPSKKRGMDASSPNARKRVHFSKDASADPDFTSTSQDVEVEQEQLRKEVREGMKQIFSSIGTTVFQQFKVPQAGEDKERIYSKVARLLNRTVDAVGKPVPGTVLAKCFSEGAVDLCTTSLFENIFQMQAIVQIRETTLNRMIAALQQQLEETVIAVARESRAKDEQMKMMAIALEKLAKMQAEKDELVNKVEALLTELHVDEAKLGAMANELQVLQAQKDSLQKHFRVSRREVQAYKVTTAQYRASLLKRETEMANCWGELALEDKRELNNTGCDAIWRAVQTEEKDYKAIEQVWKENTALQEKVKDLESKLQAQPQTPCQVHQSRSWKTSLPSLIRETSSQDESRTQTMATVSAVEVGQKVENDVQNEAKDRASSEAQTSAQTVDPEQTVYKLSRVWGTVKPLDKPLYMLPKALLMVHCEMQLTEWDSTHPENTRGGYHSLGSETFQYENVLEAQPPWRLRWFRRHPAHLDYYLQCPREQRVSSTFCPVPRRHTWKDFKKIQASNPEALNYPSLPETEEGQDLTEEWFVLKIDAIEREYDGIPDPTILMLLKILHMLKVCIEDFADIKRKTNWHVMDFFGAGLAFTFGLGPMECQLYGYFARLQYLPSHYLNTFEEAFQTNFFKHGASFVFGPQPEPVHQRWSAHQQFLKAYGGAFRPKRNFEQEKRYSKIQSALRVPRQPALESVEQPSQCRTPAPKWQGQLRCQRPKNRQTRRW